MSDVELSGPTAAVLIKNARAHRHNPDMERVLDLFATDRAAYNRLPHIWKSQAGVYADLRDSYLAAVEAGLIPDDRTPAPPTREERA